MMKKALSFVLSVGISLLTLTGCWVATIGGSSDSQSGIINLSDISAVNNTFNLSAVLPVQTLMDHNEGLTVKTVSLELIDPRNNQNTSSEEDSEPYVGLN